MEQGREGDWVCNGCNNRNYAFRSFCNRCKQPRLLVDAKTPADSKWLPRIGDWICTGCTNNNYASREKCNKCEQPKDVAAMPAIAMHGVLPSYSPYFVRIHGAPQQSMNFGFHRDGARSHSFQNPSWLLSGGHSSGSSYSISTNLPPPVPKGWRNGDWMCQCGFHNYSSREQCKSCNASMPPALGTKRLASDEFTQEWDNKRANLGNTDAQLQLYLGDKQMVIGTGAPNDEFYAPYSSSISSDLATSWQAPIQFPLQAMLPTLLGKGAKQWRDGDWMCTNCSNHNYASRSSCNRCKTERKAVSETGGAL